MTRTGRPKAELVLTEQERERLQAWCRRRKSAQGLALRSRIVLLCADGLDNTEVARRVGCSDQTVGKWRAPVVAPRVAGVGVGPRPGRPPPVTAPPGRG